MIDMKVQGSHVHIINDFSKYGTRAATEVSEELDSISLDIVSAIKLAMRNTTKSSTPNAYGHYPSVPGAPPAIQSGKGGGGLVNSFEIDRIGNSIEIGTNVKYGAYLQHGVKGGKAITVRNASILSDGKSVFGKSVIQGEIKARPFLEPGVNSIDFPVRISAAIRRAFAK